jgi:hypothetical protein
MDRHSKYTLIATCLLSGGAAIETCRLLLNAPWPGFSALISHLVSGAFGTLWGVTAVSLWFRRDSIVAGRVAWVGSFVAPFVMFLHAAVTHMGGSSIGIVYAMVAALLALSLKRVWDRGERLSTTAGTYHRAMDRVRSSPAGQYAIRHGV